MVAARGLNRNGGARGNGEARKGDGGWSGIGISRAAIPQGTGGHSPSGFLTSDSDNKRAVAGRSLLSSSEEQKRPIRAGMLNSGADSSGPHSGTRAPLSRSRSSFAGDGAIRLGGDVPGPSETCWQPSVVTSVDMLARAGAGSFQGSSVVPTAASDPMAALNTPRWAWAPPPPPDAYRGLYVPTPPASAPASQRLSGAPGGWSSLPPSWYPAPGMPPQHAAFSQAPLAATSALAPEAQKHSPLGSAGGGDARGLGGAQYGGVPSAAAPRPPGMMPPPSHAQPSFSGHPLVAPRPPPPPQDYQFAHYAPPSGAPYGQQGQPSHSQPAWSHPPVGQLRAYASVDEGQSPMWQRSVMGGMTPGAPTPTALGGSSLLGSSMLSPHAGQQQAYTMGSVPVIPASPAAQLQHGGMESPAHAMGFTPMAGASMWRHPLSVPGMGYAPAAMSQGSFATSPAASADLARLSSSMALSLASHLRDEHKGHRTAVCEQCGKTFVHAGHLRRHVDSVHNKTRAHSCPQCNREFSELGNMRRHIRAVHEKRREHRCDACGQSFSAASNLKIHRQTVHQKIKAFACPVCERKFGTSSNMVAHSRSVHGLESLWDCTHCGSSFATYDSLCRHISALHEGMPVPSETELSASMKDRPA
ncbi:hypothetical protein FNF28_03923 [Cafeteria roenbergensis]|uniref:C2H2-type domain-containing protein n=1 Tax=Cafeteria roenbergensis TaxID=33653 RepID=A0A5A8DG35_CAFRO|nr:hypothetical protein FNF28_03923 [Cafeteria roenbergensis]